MNPALKKLGFDQNDRVAIVHADDIGMCQATLPALAGLAEAGLLSSAATMVPCPWFPQVAAFCHDHPELDVGVHLTLTCEYRSYRWGPISTRDPASGLMDEEGYFHFGPDGVWAHATPEAAAGELAAQVARALSAGIDVTHIDTHQLSVLHQKFVAGYGRLAVDHHLPLMMLRKDAGGWYALAQGMGMPVDWETAHLLAEVVRSLEEQGVALVDHAWMLPLYSVQQSGPTISPEERVELAKQAFAGLPAGLTHLVLHPAVDTPELQAITADWPSRAADYAAFTSPELHEFVRRSGVQVIGYRALRDSH